MQAAIGLTSGAWSLLADPVHGGRIVECSFQGRPVFQPGQAGMWPEDEDAGCFPLIPYSNRIKDGVFMLGPERIVLRPPEFSMPHALHGSGWRRSWNVTNLSENAICMQMAYEGTGWPWFYLAKQVWKIDGSCLSAEISITNRAATPMPAGLGFHPYFADAGALIPRVKASGIWHTLSDADPLPQHWKPMDRTMDFFSGPASGLPHLDHCLTGWERRIELSRSDEVRQIQLTASAGLGNLVVYRPAGRTIFCAEPVSHISNALNLSGLSTDQDIALLLPGDTLSGSIRLEVF